MRNSSRDLLVVCLVAVVATAAALFNAIDPALDVARAFLALPLALLLPGYALTAAVFPGPSLGTTALILWSSGMSLAVVIVGGLALNWTPWGLNTGTWAVLLCEITLAASLIAWLRRRQIPSTYANRPRTGPGWRATALLLIAGLFTVAAILVAGAGASQQYDPGFTQLWMVQNGQNTRAVRVGLTSKEFAPKTYRLQIKTAGDVLYEWPPVTLQPGETWDAQVVLGSQVVMTTPVDALLYDADSPGRVYRRAQVWMGQP